MKSQILTFYSDQTGQAKSFVFYNKRDFSLISKIICHCGAILNVRKKYKPQNFYNINLHKSLWMFVNLDSNSNTVSLHGGHRFTLE